MILTAFYNVHRGEDDPAKTPSEFLPLKIDKLVPERPELKVAEEDLVDLETFNKIKARHEGNKE